MRCIREWAKGRSMPADPEVVGAHLDGLEDRSPGGILASARPVDSPIHCLYDWDVNRAAEQHWLEVSRQIPRRLVAVYVDREVVKREPAFVHVPPESGTGQGQYMPPRSLNVSEGHRARQELLRHLVAMEAALRGLEAALGVTEAVTRLREITAEARELVQAV